MPIYTAEKINFDNTTVNAVVIDPRGVTFEEANFAGVVTGAGATGLANNATVYTASVAINGTAIPIAVTGSTAQTFTTLVDEINTDLGVNATAAIVNGNIRITAATSGALIKITDTDLFSSLTGYVSLLTPRKLVRWSNISQLDQARLTAMVDLYGGSLPISPTAGLQTVDMGGTVVGGNATGLAATDAAGYQIVNFGDVKEGTSATGLANGATVYGAEITVDGTQKIINITGSAAQTITTLITEVDTDLAAAATIAIADGDLKVTSATTGGSSSVSILDGVREKSTVQAVADVAGSLAGTYFTLNSPTTAYYVYYTVASGGADPAPGGKTLLGVVDVATNATAGDVAAATQPIVHAHVAFNATVLTDTVTVTNADVGVATDATAGDTGFTVGVTTHGRASLFGAITNFINIMTAVPGVADAVYTATVIVDGVVKAISVTDTAANTFTNLITAIDVDLGGSATAAISGGNITITSATTPTAMGSVSTVAITDGTLFSSLTGYVGINAAVPGVFNFEDALMKNKASNGVPMMELIGSEMEITELKPANNPRFSTTNVVYHDGAVWRFYATDAKVV